MIYWVFYAGYLLYLEIVFHLGCFGPEGGNPVFMLGLAGLFSSVQAIITGCFAGRGKKAVYWLLTLPEFLIFFVQAVYYRIFKMPLQIEAVLMSGGDALTDFWQTALEGTSDMLPLIFLLFLPLPVFAVIMRCKKSLLSDASRQQRFMMRIGICAGLACCVCQMLFGSLLETDDSQEYLSYYDPEGLLRDMGVLTLVQRDAWYALNIRYGIDNVLAMAAGGEDNTVELPEIMPDYNTDQPLTDDVRGQDGTPIEGAENAGGEDQGTQPPEPDRSPNVFRFDWDKLAELSSGNKETKWLAEYIVNAEPTGRNEYTGLFKGYNLIYLTAEAFCTYAVSEELTPTLYNMLNSSFVFTNYYVPLWQTSTSDGEYINCCGLIPDGQYSMRKSADNNMAYTLPRFFAREGVYSWAYHNNSLSYYERYLTHPNLGYDFKALKLGNCSEEEWGDKLFNVEHASAWPASDYEMIKATLPEYLNQDRFDVYYMTVSGHCLYTFKGNMMASWHKKEVEDLPYSEDVKGYLACNIELDRALAYLLEQLEAAGKLENTVICLSADHYPYALSDEEYEELAGKDLSQDMDKYRNSLILWNGGMKQPVVVDKACGSMDILPTLLNLFGFDYDSRMYAGRDVFSDGEGLVIFNDRSYVTDTAIYSRKKKTTSWLRELSEEEQNEYAKRIKQEVADRYNFSAYILRNDYYDIVSQCVKE